MTGLAGDAEPCPVCAEFLYFETDGLGRIVPRCPCCHDGWKPQRAHFKERWELEDRACSEPDPEVTAKIRSRFKYEKTDKDRWWLTPSLTKTCLDCPREIIYNPASPQQRIRCSRCKENARAAVKRLDRAAKNFPMQET